MNEPTRQEFDELKEEVCKFKEQQIMNDPIRQHKEEHKKEHEKFERTINENLTLLLGMAMKTEEQVRLFREETREELRAVNDRLTRLDDRLTEAHKDIAEIELKLPMLATKEDIKDIATKGDIPAIKTDIDSIKTTQEQILKLLQRGETYGK